MYENAVIKKFETSQIQVISENVYKITGKTILLYLSQFITVFGTLYGCALLLNPAPNGNLSTLMVCLIFTVIIGTGATLFSNMADVWKQIIPSYRVTLKGISGTDFDRSFYAIPDIYITKTTPEQDQIEICKAAQSLEPYARDSDQSQATIKKIAENCK